MDISREEHRIFIDKQGQLLAEITFPFVDEQLVDIDHTFVDVSLRGQGIAGVLMREAVTAIRAQGWKCVTTCPYAYSWMKKHIKEQDIWTMEETL